MRDRRICLVGSLIWYHCIYSTINIFNLAYAQIMILQSNFFQKLYLRQRGAFKSQGGDTMFREPCDITLLPTDIDDLTFLVPR